MINDKLDKEDRKFLANVNIANRNFLTDISKFFMSMKLAFTSMILSGYGVFVSLTSIILKDKFSLYILFLLYLDLLLFILLLLGLFWYWCRKEEKKNIADAKHFNKQYQRYFKQLFPNSNDEYI